MPSLQPGEPKPPKIDNDHTRKLMVAASTGNKMAHEALKKIAATATSAEKLMALRALRYVDRYRGWVKKQ